MKRTPRNRKVLTLKHGHGKTHELDCPRLNGPKAHPDWSVYETVRADQIRFHNGHCSHC
jgi:hypothetical protein